MHCEPARGLSPGAGPPYLVTPHARPPYLVPPYARPPYLVPPYRSMRRSGRVGTPV